MVTVAPTPKLHIPVPVWVPVVSWVAVLGLALMLVFAVRGWWRRRHRAQDHRQRGLGTALGDLGGRSDGCGTPATWAWSWSMTPPAIAANGGPAKPCRPSCGYRPSASSRPPTGCEPGWAPCPASA